MARLAATIASVALSRARASISRAFADWGKWTTFRAFSEQAADVALKNIGQARQTSTQHVAIGGGRNYPADEAGKQNWLQQLRQKTELPLSQLNILFERYGTYAEEVAQYISAENDAPLQHIPTSHGARYSSSCKTKKWCIWMISCSAVL